MHTLPVGLSQSPSAVDLFQPKANASTTTGSSSGSSSSSGGLTGTTTGTTFLSLLVDELQNQDPTSPMDSTAMVGQMISLNSLDQLVSINSELGGNSSTASTTPSSALPGVSAPSGSGGQSSAQLVAAKNALLSDSSLASQVNPASLAASNPNTTLDLSSFTNQFGGK